MKGKFALRSVCSFWRSQIHGHRPHGHFEGTDHAAQGRARTLGVRPGDKLEVDLLADRRMHVRSKRGTSVAAVFGMLAKPRASLSVEEMNEIAASGWAGKE